jgi:hypothetical protein
MKTSNTLQNMLLATALFSLTGNASARLVEAIPEPSILSLTGIGIVIAIIAYRMKGGK